MEMVIKKIFIIIVLTLLNVNGLYGVMLMDYMVSLFVTKLVSSELTKVDKSGEVDKSG